MREVRRLRQERGWTQTQLAFHSGLATSVISQIETGKRNPSASTLRKLAAALGAEVADLFPKASAPLPGLEQPPEPTTTELPSLEATASLEPATFLEARAGDLEEWAYSFHEGADPAELPELEFIAFVGGVSVAIDEYSRWRAVVDGLQAGGEISEDVARAWRRLSRVMLAMVTPAVEKRASELEAGALPENVVQLSERKSA